MYNDWANRKLIAAIKQSADQTEQIKLFSHLIHTQNKWMNRITKKLGDSSFKWFGEPFGINELEDRWDESITRWISLIEKTDENGLQNDVTFKRGSDGHEMKLSLLDLTLQMNYHSIHHRAQINKLLSAQGIVPPATDYIFTVLREA